MLPNISAVILVILLSSKTTVQQIPTQCGEKKATRNYMIIGGTDTKPGAWPWHAALFTKKGQTMKYVCGGTLIGTEFVLTAAHCIINAETGSELPPERIAVRLGIYDLNDLSTQQECDIRTIYKPGDFTSDGTKNDIAILKLRQSANLNSYVQPACLGTFSSLAGTYGAVVGWGMTEGYKLTSKLKSAVMPVVSSSTCINSNPDVFGQTLDRTMLCAGYTNGTSVCNGDSGGGLFFKVGSAWYLGGIVSFAAQRDDGSNLCSSESYGAFTNVGAYLSWILEKTGLRLSSTQQLTQTTSTVSHSSEGNVDCGPGCRDFNCHVDRRCVSNVAHKTAVHYPHRDCTKYYTCKERSNVICEFDCPAGLHFNRNRNVCDWSWSAGCTS